VGARSVLRGYPGLLEASGYCPTYPFGAFDVSFSAERYRTASRGALEDVRRDVRPLDKKRWVEDVERLRSVFNETVRTESSSPSGRGDGGGVLVG
jgi:hypothetical protein